MVIVTDFDECESTPCKNNGTCINKFNSYQCICHNGALGTNCGTGRSMYRVSKKGSIFWGVGTSDVNLALIKEFDAKSAVTKL